MKAKAGSLDVATRLRRSRRRDTPLNFSCKASEFYSVNHKAYKFVKKNGKENSAYAKMKNKYKKTAQRNYKNCAENLSKKHPLRSAKTAYCTADDDITRF